MSEVGTPGPRDRDLAATAALVGDPTRAVMLAVLASGRALPAGELARGQRTPCLLYTSDAADE